MSEISNLNEKIYTLKITYSKPLIIELSANTGTQGMGVTPIFMFMKTNIGTENTFALRSPS